MSKKSSKGCRRPGWMSKELLAKLKWINLWNVERGTGPLGGIQESCQSMQGCNEEG